MGRSLQHGSIVVCLMVQDGEGGRALMTHAVCWNLLAHRLWNPSLI
jgi:hypothetical protein